MFYKNLKWQLLLTSIIAVIVIVFMIVLALNGYTLLTVFLALLLAAYIILVNIWFRRYVTKPIEALTDAAKEIAGGSYGVQVETTAEDEIGELTHELNSVSLKVAESDRVTTEFISQISHELRTPLTAIIGWTDTVLKEDEAIQGYSRKGVEIISTEAGRLTEMVKDLLEFTRIQGNRFNLHLELIDIAAELEDSIFTYGNLMKEAGIEINYDAPDCDIPLISGDSERLKQVFLNLLDNAAKHGKDGKNVDIVLKTTSNSVLISIRDHGAGIPAEELPHVKEKFYKGSSRNRGSGIGLAVCDEIITRHGGKLIIANAEGGGCIATIQLPMNNN